MARASVRPDTTATAVNMRALPVGMALAAQLQCDCGNGASCQPSTGHCVCPPGYQGTRCEKECDQGRFGQSCSQVCECEEGVPCEPLRGRCLCTAGKTGARCDTDCRVNLYGPDCGLSCEW
ncbi:multiple epidermal growth factor-like domains protein 11 [Clupea harengus]|uniref:Multiple epidermal growth factor-like domains protein 11 n=1 Tax=Clupea harengus TaxID=7950 RepID=A0A6P8GJV8_CLUHA|nr:multiple epidermal growth factor-like domains protein 11 [Clupea harengus]